MTCLNILFTRYTNFYNEKNGYCFSPVVSTAHEIKKMPGLLMARGTKILVILITLALNEQGFSSTDPSGKDWATRQAETFGGHVDTRWFCGHCAVIGCLVEWISKQVIWILRNSFKIEIYIRRTLPQESCKMKCRPQLEWGREPLERNKKKLIVPCIAPLTVQQEIDLISIRLDGMLASLWQTTLSKYFS